MNKTQDPGRALQHVRGTMPFAEMALTLFWFTSRLHDAARGGGGVGFERLWFLSREGAVLQSLFDLHQRLLVPPGERVDTRYLMVSRRSTHVAVLKAWPDERFEGLRTQDPDVDGAGLERHLGLSPTDGDTRPLDEVLADDDFGARYERRRTEQLDLLRRYLAQEGVRSGANLVDVGWKGTMQHQIDHALQLGDHDAPVTGWYLGLVGHRVADPDRMNGLLFTDRPAPSRRFKVFRHFKSLYEFLLNADHGSVLGYADRGDRIEALLDPIEAEIASHERIIAPYQRQLLSCFARLLGEVGAPLADSPDVLDVVARNHARMVWTPRRAEREMVADLAHYENFGKMAMVDVGELERRSRGRADALRRLATDRSDFLSGSWPPLRLETEGLGALTSVIGGARVTREFVIR